MRPLPSWHLMPPALAASSGLHPYQALGWLLALLVLTALIGALARPAFRFWFHLRRGLAMLAHLCGWFLCAVADCAWSAMTLRGRRARRHPLGRAERDSRRKLGMPAHHPEHLACGPPDTLAALQRELWPGFEWTEVIEDYWRERGHLG